MGDVDDLVQWLRAQWDADEQMWGDILGGGSELTLVEHYFRGGVRDLLKRQLAEVEAKRRILDLYEVQRDNQAVNGSRFVQLTKQTPTPYEELTQVKTHGWELGGRVHALGHAVRLLALPYADRPGYRDEWRP